MSGVCQNIDWPACYMPVLPFKMWGFFLVHIQLFFLLLIRLIRKQMTYTVIRWVRQQMTYTIIRWVRQQMTYTVNRWVRQQMTYTTINSETDLSCDLVTRAVAPTTMTLSPSGVDLNNWYQKEVSRSEHATYTLRSLVNTFIYLCVVSLLWPCSVIGL